MWKNQNLHPTHHKVLGMLELHHRHHNAVPEAGDRAPSLSLCPRALGIQLV